MQDELQTALNKMQAALELLDRSGAAGGVGAHLDLAINRLVQILGQHDDAVKDVMEVAAK